MIMGPFGPIIINFPVMDGDVFLSKRSFLEEEKTSDR